jgi:ADP-ribosylglycohydrolase
MLASATMSEPTTILADHEVRLARARLAVEGLSLGDAFGRPFFYRESWDSGPRFRELPPPVWKYTDDSEMALGIFEVLESCGGIEQDVLATVFSERYSQNPYRGYGAGAHDILGEIARGTPWRTAAGGAFEGRGSLGNGAAMRVAPVGAFFADDFSAAIAQARLSAEVTHLHPEGIAGAIAVAAATAWAWQNRGEADRSSANDLTKTVLELTPESETRQGIEVAATIPLDTWEFTAAERLGNGSRIRSSDTVPFCIWSAARGIDDYCEALWTTAAVGGDIDTNCAIVGGIVALAVGETGLPGPWLAHREPLQWNH